MIINKIEKESNILTFNKKGKLNDMNIQNTNVYESVSGYSIPIQNILRGKYRDLILTYEESKTFTDEEYRKYKFQPKSLSYDLYNTIDLWHLLLWINDMTSVTQFTKKTIKVLSTDVLKEINNILNIESNPVMIT